MRYKEQSQRMNVPKNRVDRYARDSETFENSEVIVGWMAIKRSGNKTATEIKRERQKNQHV